MRYLLFFLLATAAVADSRTTGTVWHHWLLTATPTSQSQDLTNTTDRGPASPSALGPAKSIIIIPTGTGSDVVVNLTDATANATPTNGGNNIPVHAGQVPYRGDGIYAKLAYVSSGTTQTFEVVTQH
jgi:hypothetical protein